MTLPNDELRRSWEAVAKHKNFIAAARDLGDVTPDALRFRVARAISRLNLPHPLSSTVEFAHFIAYRPADESRSIDELIAHKREEAERALSAEDTANVIRVDLKTAGPVGLLFVGDPHVDSPGCDFPRLEAHLDLVRPRQEYIFAVNAGDVQDNWIGRLARLYGDSTVSKREAWRLVEWLMTTILWAVLIRGNHDAWSGGNDPLDWIARGAGVGIDRYAGARIAWNHPNGAVTRTHIRHDFRGNSVYNPLHALKKEALNAARDHVIVAAHRHIGADAGDFIDGLAFQMLRVSGYKRADHFRHEIGLHIKPLHPSGLVIVDPDEPDESRARAWVAPTVEAGVDYLDFLRKRFKESA